MLRLIQILVLGLAACVSYWFYLERADRADPANQPVPVVVDGAPAEVAQPVEVGPMLPAELIWQADERWLRALPVANSGVERAIELYRWHEEEGGDPLHFRREKEDLAKALLPALEELRSLRGDYADNEAAVIRIDREIQRIQGAVGGTVR